MPYVHALPAMIRIRPLPMTPRSPFRTLALKAEWAVLAAVVFLFRLVPVDRASAAMGFLWRKLAPLNKRHKRALKHLELAMPELTASERRKIIDGMWDNLGRVTAETFQIDRMIRDESRFELQVDARTDAILNGAGPCVFVSMHSACWELCVTPAFQRGLPMAGVYQALKNPFSDALLRSLRGTLYPLGLYSKGHQTARKLLSILRSGGVFALMADLRERRGVKVPFFGREAYATPVPATLARACGVPIVIGRVVRLEGARFRIEGICIDPASDGDKEADILATTAAIHAQFEAWIREVPEQWMWIHRKWAD